MPFDGMNLDPALIDRAQQTLSGLAHPQTKSAQQYPDHFYHPGDDNAPHQSSERHAHVWHPWDPSYSVLDQAFDMLVTTAPGSNEFTVYQEESGQLMAEVDRLQARTMDIRGNVDSQELGRMSLHPGPPQFLEKTTQPNHGRVTEIAGVTASSVSLYAGRHPSSYRPPSFSTIDGGTEYSLMDTSVNGSSILEASSRTGVSTGIGRDFGSGHPSHFGQTQQRSRAIDELSVPISQEGSLVCKFCRARFNDRSGLRYGTSHDRKRTIDKRLTRSRHHLETHTDKARRYPCEHVGCNATARYPKDLERHMRTHTKPEISPFPCEEPGCARTFSRRDNLLRHLRDKHADSATVQAIFAASPTAHRRPRGAQTNGDRSHLTASGASGTTTSSIAGDPASHPDRPQAPVTPAPTFSFVAQNPPSSAPETTQPIWEDWTSRMESSPSILTPLTTQLIFSNRPNFLGPH